MGSLLYETNFSESIVLPKMQFPEIVLYKITNKGCLKSGKWVDVR